MASIETVIKLNDQMSAKLEQIDAALNSMASTMSTVDEATRSMGDQMSDALRKVPDAASGAGNGIDALKNKLAGLAAAVGGITAVRQVVGLSDELTSTTARLSMVGDAFKETGFDVDAFTTKIYNAANASRGSFDAMSSLVNRLGMNATDAFSSTDELVQFAETVQKIMTISGASTQEAANAELQLSQALASGVLRGDELNSIFEQSPMLIQKIAEYMGVTTGEIRGLASEGAITADIVKNAVLDKTKEINDAFDNMPMTFGQAMTQMGNTALQAFTPVLNNINSALNSATGQAIIADLTNNIYTAANIASAAIDVLGNAFELVYNNASYVAAVLPVVVGAITAYNVAAGITSAINMAMKLSHDVAAASAAMHANATFAATAAQYGFNTALLACPITWIVAGIAAAVAGILLFANAIAETDGVSTSAFSVICGWITYTVALFQDLWTCITLLCSDIPIAFNNAVAGAQAAFWDLLATATSVISQIADKLNLLPFVSIDTAGLTSAADNYAAKADAARAKKQAYNSLPDTWQTDDAYERGAKWGNNKMSALTGIKDKLTGSSSGAAGASNSLDSIAKSSGATAGNTGNIKDSLDDTEEDIKELCDIAERDAINRFTTASISVDMVNNNSISSGMDLDNIVDGLAARLQTSMAMVAEGA